AAASSVACEHSAIPSPNDSATGSGSGSGGAVKRARAHGQEPARGRTARALAYLQRQVAPLVDGSDAHESRAFHALSTALFGMSEAGADGEAGARVYEALLAYFPRRQQQPAGQLESYVTGQQQ
ncbi:hypothetical protein IWW55_006045, partial [Coemansia sp. RSA 2706]